MWSLPNKSNILMYHFMPHWRMKMAWHSEASEVTLLPTNTKAHPPFMSALVQLKTLPFVPIAFQCMPVNGGANTTTVALNASALPTTSPVEYFITSPGMQSIRLNHVSYFARIMDALNIKNMHAVVQRGASQSNFFIRSRPVSDVFH